MKPMFILLISCKGGYKVHSIHGDLKTAQEWARCKERDGEDTSIAEVPDCIEFVEAANDILAKWQKES